jgi:pimeloyl-ACP methyl ester carboxylesterase
MASGSRTAALQQLEVPTVVIHGESDPLVPLRAGLATARAIPNSRLLTIPGMGHNLPEPLWPTFVDAIVKNTERAAERQAA